MTDQEREALEMLNVKITKTIVNAIKPLVPDLAASIGSENTKLFLCKSMVSIALQVLVSVYVNHETDEYNDVCQREFSKLWETVCEIQNRLEEDSQQ